MAVDTQAVAVRLDMTQSSAATVHQGNELTGIAVYDGQAWLSLCRENGIASEGDSSVEALSNLLDAVREAIEFAVTKGIEVGPGVPEEELYSFMVGHREGAGSVQLVRFRI